MEISRIMVYNIFEHQLCLYFVWWLVADVYFPSRRYTVTDRNTQLRVQIRLTNPADYEISVRINAIDGTAIGKSSIIHAHWFSKYLSSLHWDSKSSIN